MIIKPSARGCGALAIASLSAMFLSGLPVHTAVAQSQIAENYQAQRALFEQGRELLASGNTPDATDLSSNLEGYPLHAYYEYLILRQRIESAESPLKHLQSIDRFKRTFGDKRSHRRLLGVMKNRLTKTGDWKGYARIAAMEGAPVHPCDDLYSRVTVGELKGFDSVAATLWYSVHKHTARCKEAFDVLIKRTDTVPVGALWKRTIALLRRGSFDDVKKLFRFFSVRDRRVLQSWMDNMSNPQALLALEKSGGNLMHHPKLVSHVLKRWASADLSAAASFWKSNGTVFGFDQKEVNAVTARHAVIAAQRDLPEAAEMLRDAPADTRAVRYWRIRAALREKDWQSVLTFIDQLTPEQQTGQRWRYWRGRALEALGRSEEAEKLFTAVAGEYGYYGFLAADRQARSYLIVDKEPVVDADALSGLVKDPEIIKAIEFFLVGIEWEGRRLWNSAIKGADDKKLIAAAELALTIGWYDRSFASIRKAGKDSALRFQYPMPYDSLVESLVQGRAASASQVYAVIRRESAYIPDVASPAGAKGLMQLMPATAKEVAGKVFVQKSAWSLVDGEVNIQLGVEYLDSMLNRFDGNFALAVAAYNAGPTRVRRWTDGEQLPMDIWIETIPFDETRDYVKGVLVNTVVFNFEREQPQVRLESLMGVD